MQFYHEKLRTISEYKRHVPRKKPAFTLIELLVVLGILSIIMFLITPRFLTFLHPQKTRYFMLSLLTTLNYLNERAVMEKKVYYFNFDLDERRYYFTVAVERDDVEEVGGGYLKSAPFPDNLSVKEVKVTPGESLNKGKMIIPFTPKGMLYSFEIVVEEGKGSVLMLEGNSISNRIELFRVNEGGRIKPFD
ncbi:MAG: pilus assembly FimT family protein [Spirochaetota bacterium]